MAEQIKLLRQEKPSSVEQNRSVLNPTKGLGLEPPRQLRRAIPSPEPFPIQALGGILSGAAQALHQGIQAPIALCAQSVLAAANLVVQGHGNVVIDGRLSPLSCYFLTIGESGERKSAVDTEALYECRKFESECHKSYKKDLRSFDDSDMAYKRAREEQLKKAKDLAAKCQALADLGEPPKRPLEPALIAQEPTYEGLYRQLRDGRPSLGLFSDESGTFVGGHAMNQENKLKMAAGLSSLWDGKPLTRTRGGDGAFQLAGRRVCCHLMAQPRVAAEFLGDGLLIEQGLLSRFLVCFPETTAGQRIYTGLNLTINPAMNAFHGRIRELLEAPLPVCEDDKQQLNPPRIDLSREARKNWIEFYNLIEKQLADDQPLKPIRGFANKAAEHVLRLAGTMTLFEDLHATEISSDHLLNGIDLVQYYLSEALRLSYAGTCDPKLKLAEKLLDWCQQHDFVHLQQIYQYGPNQVRDATTAKQIAHILEDHGWLTPIEKGMELEGTLRKRAWRVIKCS
jgi:hypothetical protein